MIARLTCLLVFSQGVAGSLSGAIIGTNTPAQPLTAARIVTLPTARQPAWKEYLRHSTRQMQDDQAFLRAEMKAHGLTESIAAPPARSFDGLRFDRPDAWYASTEARRIADIIVSFQTPAGGWSKHIELTQQPRAPGQRFDGDTGSRFLTNSDNDRPQENRWSYVGTFDNGATTTQLRFLAKIIAASGDGQAAVHRTAFLHGLDYIFQAQYPNGGWPQVWPLDGGYHDAITYNDGAMINALELLREVSEGRGEFAFTPAETRARAAVSLKRGIECILATQIIVDGRRTVWCQQHDTLTLRPAAARNYEMPSQSSAESAGIMMFLMKLPGPGPDIIAAINASAAWFKKTQMFDVAYKNTALDERQLVREPGNGPIWSRYYEIDTDRPIFGDRDKTIHDQVDEISKERRRGYAWFGDSPKRALQEFETWRRAQADQVQPKTTGSKTKAKPTLKSPKDTSSNSDHR